MAITTTGIMRNQLMSEPLDTTPEAGMEGGVNRPSIVGDLMEAMRDLDFRQLMEQYAAMTGQNVAASRPLTNQMMKEEIPAVSNMPVLPGAPNVPGAPEGSQVYSNMPVQSDNLNNAPGVDDVMRQNLGLMQPRPLEV
jgi:hypothetical protein